MANKTKREEKRRAARLRTNAKHQVVEKDVEVDLDFEDEDEIIDLPEQPEDEEGEPEVEQVSKSYDPYMTTAGPTSWGEYDAMKIARERAENVRSVSWTVQDLVSNIVVSNMPVNQKAKAIQAVGDGFSERLKEVDAEYKMEKAIDFELLELQALIAKDSRRITTSEKITDWVSKAKLTGAAEKKLSDSDFALVRVVGDKKIRKYPIHNKAHIRNALARAAQMIAEGGDAAVDAKAALPKIKSAAKKMGIGMMNKSVSAVVIEKDASNSWRAVMWPSNNFIDWQGDIISESAHLEYVDWVNKNMDCAPVFMAHHIPGTARKNRVDFVGYENGFLLMSAPLEPQEAERLLKTQALTDIGMSHGTVVLERDQNDLRVVTKYRMVEVSDLPLSHAANPFTDFETLMKEADMGNVDTKAYLASILGSEEEAEKYISKAGIKQAELNAVGVESKAKEETSEKPVVEKASVAANDDIIAQVMERVSKELDVPGLNEYLADLQSKADKVYVLEGLVKELVQGNDQKLAELIEPPVAQTLIWKKARSSQSKETILKDEIEEDEKLKKAKPELGWLSVATSTDPVKI